MSADDDPDGASPDRPPLPSRWSERADSSRWSYNEGAFEDDDEEEEPAPARTKRPRKRDVWTEPELWPSPLSWPLRQYLAAAQSLKLFAYSEAFSAFVLMCIVLAGVLVGMQARRPFVARCFLFLSRAFRATSVGRRGHIIACRG